jgi:TfoX/Sxy family transcriptional regulator of competence genes
MPYNHELAERIRKVLIKLGEKDVIEKEMFGGLSFLVKGKMGVGVFKDKMVVRVNDNERKELLKLEGVAPMDFTSKPMKGFVYVKPSGYKSDNEIEFWITKGVKRARELVEY